MTSEETMKLLRAISAAYPSYKPNDMKDTAEIWTFLLGDVSYTAALAALKSYIREGNEFAPNAGQLYALLKNVTTTDPTEAEAWNMVLTAIKRSTYFAQEEFDHLPDDIQKAIGSPEYLRSLAMAEDVNWGVESSNFYKNYRIIKERERQIENLPDGVRNYIEAMKAKTPAVENKQTAALLEAKANYEEYVGAAYDKINEKYTPKELEPTETGESFRENLMKRFGHNGTRGEDAE